MLLNFFKVRKAISVIIAVMHREQLNSKEAVLLYKDEMTGEYPHDYLDLITNENNIVINDIYTMMVDTNMLY
jgi:hypothetical protein